MTPAPSRFWRYAALVTSLGNAAFGALQERLGLGGRSMVAVTDSYPNLFRPAGYAFSIWIVIYAAFIGYAAWALSAGQRDVRAHDRVAPPLALANVLCGAWTVAYRHDQIGLTVALIAAALGCGVWMYTRAHAAVAAGALGRAAAVPFSLFLGGIYVATIANVTLALVAAGWQGGAVDPPVWAALLLAVAASLGAMIAFRHRDAVVPLVVAWAAVAIAVQQASASRLVVGAAITAAAASVIVAALAVWSPSKPLTPARAH
jgi:hypothetical protein